MLLERLSKRIAKEIKRSDPEGSVSIEVMEYALGIKLNLIATLVLTTILGWATGQVLNSLLALFAFAVARRFSGGLHMKSLTGCALVSSLLFAGIPLVQLSESWVVIISGCSVLLFLAFAPNDCEEVNPSKMEPYLKAISVAIAATNLYLESSVIGLAFFAQSLSILPWKGGKIR